MARSTVSCIASPIPVSVRYTSMSGYPRDTTVRMVPTENSAMPDCRTALREKPDTRQRKAVLATHLRRHQREELPIHGVDDVRAEQDAEHDDPGHALPQDCRVDVR